MSAEYDLNTYAFSDLVTEICDFAWADLDEQEIIAAAWAYYFFSIQFRENLLIACDLYPDDAKLARLRGEECDTDNLSPWPGVAASMEKLNHDEFVRRFLLLSPVSDDKRRWFEAKGARYLGAIRSISDAARAASLASYEDGDLERLFRAMLRTRTSNNPAIGGLRHFLSEHIRFDSDPTGGHGALSRHLRADDRILPLWSAFRELLLDLVPDLNPAVPPDRYQRTLDEAPALTLHVMAAS